jgi:Domain of unknown function (DUF397)
MHPRLLIADEGPAIPRGGGLVADFEVPYIAWRKSTASNSGGCVEVAVVGGSVLIRDSANPDGLVLSLSPAAWSAFLARARSNDLLGVVKRRFDAR